MIQLPSGEISGADPPTTSSTSSTVSGFCCAAAVRVSARINASKAIDRYMLSSGFNEFDPHVKLKPSKRGVFGGFVPIFEYYCGKCDDAFEKLVMPSDKSTVVCPRCRSKKVEQLISAPAIHNTSSKNAVLDREYKAYNKRWKENAYMPKPKKKSKD